MCNSRLSILFVFTFLIITGTKAQESLNYSFRYITQADGLLHNEVLSIAQDGKGFIWLATLSGLQRYDGSRFVYYPEILSNPAVGLTPGANIYADKKNNLLWISSDITIEKMKLGKNQFTVYEPDQLLKDTSFRFNSYQGANNQQWMLGQNVAYHYDSVARINTFTHLNILPANARQGSYMATDSSGNNTWVVTGSQLLLFDKRTRKVYSDNFNPGHHPLLQQLLYSTRRGDIRFIMIDSRQNIWFTTWSDILYKYDEGTKKISAFSLLALKTKQDGGKISAATPLINCILEDDNHTIWVGTEHAGLLRYNRENDNFDYCIAREKNSEGIRYNYKIYALLQDKEQNIWVGTDKGVSIFNPYRQYFTSIRHEEKNPLSISKSEIISFIQISNGDIFIGTWGGGIAVYDSHFKFKKNIVFNGTADKNKVWCFQQVDNETLWIGCQHGYLIVYNIITGVTQTLQPPEMEGYTIRCMEKDNKGNIWVGLQNGKIIKWDKQQGKFFPYGAGQQDSLKRAPVVLNIFIDRAQQCWVSTQGGFKEFDTEKMLYSNIWLPDKNNTTSISGSTCQGIEEYNDSTLLIGTIHGGLNFFNKRTKTFSHLTIADGLPSGTIYAIKKDTTGYIWFTTDYGLCRFNPADKKIVPYSMGPGLINSSFLSNKFYSLQDGQWLTFSSTEAISFFPHKTEYADTRRPRIEITGFKLFDNSMSIDSLLLENKPVRLSYKENFFTVEFAALIFSGQQQTNYYYRLAGVDKDWVNGGKNRFASYTDLKPGEYTFEVKAENGDSAGMTTSFKIIITPPWWKTWWFTTLICLCVLLLIYGFVKWREKNIKAIAKEKLKVQELNAGQYKSKLEMELIINYFSSSLLGKRTEDEVLWDVANNLIGRLGFVDCMIYLWNADKTKMVQRAGFGPKGSIEEINSQPFDVLPGQGVVGYVMQTKEPVLLPDTSKDSRYRPDEMTRSSEITVPVIYNDELIGVIDCEHHEKNFFTPQHLQILSTIATLMANKIESINAEQLLHQSNIEMSDMTEQLSKAKLEALRSQMNPHFIFNCINSIDALIQTNDKYHATLYLNKFAKLIRNILDSSNQDTVTLAKDLDTLKLYIELEQLRHENKFIAEIRADEDLLQDDYKIPPLIIQPFVENAILHGLRNKEGNEGILTVDIKKVNDKIQYIITDNGIGRKAAGEIRQNKESHYGMQMSYDRIKLFNKEETASVQVKDLYKNEIAQGTEVKVNLNII
jgi:ligand-binding sensor domain-containing protein/anti-sigma regulatory factor (Ser/Thr protein kinase)